MAGTQSKKKRPIGYCFVHSAVDDHSRLAYSEFHDDEQGLTAAGVLAEGTDLLRRSRRRRTGCAE